MRSVANRIPAANNPDPLPARPAGESDRRLAATRQRRSAERRSPVPSVDRRRLARLQKRVRRAVTLESRPTDRSREQLHSPRSLQPPSGDLIHLPLEVAGVCRAVRRRVLAADLLHLPGRAGRGRSPNDALFSTRKTIPRFQAHTLGKYDGSTRQLASVGPARYNEADSPVLNRQLRRVPGGANRPPRKHLQDQ